MRFVLFILLTSCNYCPYDRNNYLNITHYDVELNAHTPKGIAVDASSADLNKIDRLTDEVESCLANLFPDGMLPDEVTSNSSCLYNSFDTTLHRDCISIKVPADWFHSCYDLNWQRCSGDRCGEQVFPCEADKRLCEAKGFEVSDECPCACRAIIQDNHTIITAPNLHLYKAELIRMMTGCNNIWTSVLASCYSTE